MGIWDKFKRNKAESETQEQDVHLVGKQSLLVVGGEYVSKDADKVPLGTDFKVELRREPSNRHDKNAVMVLHKGRKIGYFSAGRAEKYAPLIDIASRSSSRVTATATAEVAGDGVPNTNVYVPSVYELALQLGDDARHIAAASKPPVEATLKQLGKYQDRLDCVLDGLPEREVQASMVLRKTQSGKYVGKNLIAFVFQSEDIGLLPAQFRESHEEFFESVESGITSCLVLVRRYEDRIWARARI